jgi:hypothetical protein
MFVARALILAGLIADAVGEKIAWPVLTSPKDWWQALSELFLDAEVGETTYEWISQRISQSGYTLHQLQSILWNEVYPALQGNLKSMVGGWAGRMD